MFKLLISMNLILCEHKILNFPYLCCLLHWKNVVLLFPPLISEIYAEDCRFLWHRFLCRQLMMTAIKQGKWLQGYSAGRREPLLLRSVQPFYCYPALALEVNTLWE